MDCIDRNALLAAMAQTRDGFIAMGNASIVNALEIVTSLVEGQPPADSRGTGHWTIDPLRCSACGTPVSEKSAFCPHCGVRMAEE